MSPPAQPSPPITLQIISIVFFTFIAFLSIGIPLAVLPGYVHDDLAYGSVLAGVVISSQYLATLTNTFSDFLLLANDSVSGFVEVLDHRVVLRTTISNQLFAALSDGFK